MRWYCNFTATVPSTIVSSQYTISCFNVTVPFSASGKVPSLQLTCQCCWTWTYATYHWTITSPMGGLHSRDVPSPSNSAVVGNCRPVCMNYGHFAYGTLGTPAIAVETSSSTARCLPPALPFNVLAPRHPFLLRQLVSSVVLHCRCYPWLRHLVGDEWLHLINRWSSRFTGPETWCVTVKVNNLQSPECGIWLTCKMRNHSASTILQNTHRRFSAFCISHFIHHLTNGGKTAESGCKLRLQMPSIPMLALRNH